MSGHTLLSKRWPRIDPFEPYQPLEQRVAPLKHKTCPYTHLFTMLYLLKTAANPFTQDSPVALAYFRDLAVTGVLLIFAVVRLESKVCDHS